LQPPVRASSAFCYICCPKSTNPIGGYAIGQRFAVREHSPVVLTILFLKDGCSVSSFSFLPVLSLFLNSMQTLGASVWLRAKLIFADVSDKLICIGLAKDLVRLLGNYAFHVTCLVYTPTFCYEVVPDNYNVTVKTAMPCNDLWFSWQQTLHVTYLEEMMLRRLSSLPFSNRQQLTKHTRHIFALAHDLVFHCKFDYTFY